MSAYEKNGRYEIIAAAHTVVGEERFIFGKKRMCHKTHRIFFRYFHCVSMSIRSAFRNSVINYMFDRNRRLNQLLAGLIRPPPIIQHFIIDALTFYCESNYYENMISQ